MSLIDYTLGATIPTGQYANLQPQVNVAAETFAEAHAEASAYIETVWQQYGTIPLVKTGGDRKLLKAFVGGEVYYDDLTHTYTNEAGEVYLSGSQYAKQFEKPFDGAAISEKMATKYKVSGQDIRNMWELKARTSREFGTAMHSALQLYGQYNGLATALERETHLHDHPVIKQAVQSFYEARKDEKAEYEIFIVNHQAKHAGQIDRLLIKPPVEGQQATCRVQDFKTNADIEKSLPTYWKQLEFYAGIMQANGWRVEGLDIFHWNGEWRDYNRAVA